MFPLFNEKKEKKKKKVYFLLRNNKFILSIVGSGYCMNATSGFISYFFKEHWL